MQDIGRRARKAAHVLALAPAAQKDKALLAMAKAIRGTAREILAANQDDVTEAKAAGISGSFLDRLTLNPRAHRGDGQGSRGGCKAERSGRQSAREMEAAERHDDRARAHADRRHWRDL